MREVISIGVGGFGINTLENFVSDIAEDHFIGLDGIQRIGDDFDST